MQNELPTSSKPLKEKTTKAERRALQESQRAAKAAGKGPNCKFSFLQNHFLCGFLFLKIMETIIPILQFLIDLDGPIFYEIPFNCGYL